MKRSRKQSDKGQEMITGVHRSLENTKIAKMMKRAGRAIF
jgi:hypothetical protein